MTRLPVLVLAVLLAAWVPGYHHDAGADERVSSSWPVRVERAAFHDLGRSALQRSRDSQQSLGQASSIVAGTATWCAPTPTHCHGWDHGAMLGAVPGYGGHPYWAKVTHAGRSVVVRIVSWCACGDRGGVPTVVDLSPAAFRILAPLSRGVIAVTLEAGDTVPPATDTAP